VIVVALDIVHSVPIVFADNDYLMISGNLSNISDVIAKLEIDLKSANHWMEATHAKLNTDKVKFLIFSKKNAVRHLSDISSKINGEPTLRVNSLRVLGVIIDDKMSWAPHTARTSGACGFALSKLPIQDLLSINNRIIMINSLVFSKLFYASVVWMRPDSASFVVDSLIKRCIRYIFKSLKYDSISSLICECKYCKQ